MLYHLFINKDNDLLVDNKPDVKDYTKVYSIQANTWDEAYYHMVTTQKNPLLPLALSIFTLDKI